MATSFTAEYIEKNIDLTNLANIFAEKIKADLTKDNTKDAA